MDSISQSFKLKAKFLKETSLKLKTRGKNANKKTVSQVNAKAGYIAEKLHNWDYLPFYRKAVWHLPEAKVDDILSRSPSVWYFISVCKAEMHSK